MNLGQLCDELIAQNLADKISLPVIPLKHPVSGDKVYIRSAWHCGVWFTPTPNGNKVTPFEAQTSLLKFTVHPDADAELKAMGYKPVPEPAPEPERPRNPPGGSRVSRTHR